MTQASEAPRPIARRPLLQRGFYWSIWALAMLALTLLFRMRRYHLDRIPSKGAVLLVANHQSHFDPPLVGLCVRGRQYRPLARESLFRNGVFGAIIRWLNAVPLRDNEGDLGAMRTVIDLLRQGEPVCIFPEGSRTPDGAMHEFKRGVTVAIKRADCVVVPMAVEGAFDAFPRHRKLPRLWGGRIAIMAGSPIEANELLRDGPDAALRRLEREIDAMRLSLRRRLRASSRGRYPAPGPGDKPSYEKKDAKPLSLAS